MDPLHEVALEIAERRVVNAAVCWERNGRRREDDALIDAVRSLRSIRELVRFEESVEAGGIDPGGWVEG